MFTNCIMVTGTWVTGTRRSDAGRVGWHRGVWMKLRIWSATLRNSVWHAFMNKTVFTATLHFPLIHIAHFHDFTQLRFYFSEQLFRSIAFVRQQLSESLTQWILVSLTHCYVWRCMWSKPLMMVARILNDFAFKKVLSYIFLGSMLPLANFTSNIDGDSCSSLFFKS